MQLLLDRNAGLRLDHPQVVRYRQHIAHLVDAHGAQILYRPRCPPRRVRVTRAFFTMMRIGGFGMLAYLNNGP